MMSILVGNTRMSDATPKASKSIMADLQRRKKTADAGLTASKNLNMKRMTEYIEFKAQKEEAIKTHGVVLTDLENLKDSLRIKKKYLKEEALVAASEALKSYSQSMAVEKIANAALKASKMLNWKFEKNRKWGNLADTRFRSGNYKIRKDYECVAEFSAQNELIHMEFGVHESDINRLATFARQIFNIGYAGGSVHAREAIATESLVNTATKSLTEFYALQNDRSESAEPIDEELHREEDDVAQQVASLPYRIPDEYVEGFMKSRNEMSIFMDSEEAREHIAQISINYSSSSSINWSRIIKFLEFKARKEYALETYGVKLGDFGSLKEVAFKLFEISEARAAIMASESIADDFESLAMDKIADASFKSSKILNWISRNKLNPLTPLGNFADARFKSASSLMSYNKRKDVDAYKAYTMETFGADLVDIEYLKDYAIETFKCSTLAYLSEQEATIMACQTIAIDKLYDVTFKTLYSTLQNNQLKEPKQVEDSADRAMVGFKNELGFDSLSKIAPLTFF